MRIKITGLAMISLVTFILTIYLGIKLENTYTENYRTNRLYVIKTSIEYDAKRCYLEKSCEGATTISGLETKGYVNESLVTPTENITIDENLDVNFDGKNAIINWPEEISNIDK